MNGFDAEKAFLAEVRAMDEAATMLQHAEAQMAFQVDPRPVPPELVRRTNFELTSGHVALMSHVEFTPHGATAIDGLGSSR